MINNRRLKMKYRKANKILTEQEGLVTQVTAFKSINKAKRANRGNTQPPVLKPAYAKMVSTEEVK